MIVIMSFLISSAVVGYATHNYGMVQYSLGFILAYSCLMAFDRLLQLIFEYRNAKCDSKEK